MLKIRFSKIFHQVQPYLAALAVILVVTLLVAAIYFTNLGMQWITFLTGVLIAAVLGMTSRASQAEWINTRRTAQLTLAKNKLEQETVLRKKATEDHQQTLLQLQQTERAFGRLIPHQLLALMGKSNILDVKLGDQFELKLTVMCTDIRNFTTLSENMTPQENFNFSINHRRVSFFRGGCPPVRQQGSSTAQFDLTIISLFTFVCLRSNR